MLLYKFYLRITSRRFWHIPSHAVRQYYLQTPALQFPREIEQTLGQKFPRFDPLILKRSKLLTTSQGVDGRQLISVADNYLAENEIREDSLPYVSFAWAIKQAGALDGMESVLDLGCATGHLLNELQKLNIPPLIKEFSGVDIFPYHGASSLFPKGVQFHSADLRLKLESIRPADLVICTETGEHIDPASLDIFMQNLASLTKRRLVLTWSRNYPPRGAPPQHVCPLKTKEVHLLLKSYGFKFDSSGSRNLKEALKSGSGYYWWLESLSVWSVG